MNLCFMRSDSPIDVLFWSTCLFPSPGFLLVICESIVPRFCKFKFDVAWFSGMCTGVRSRTTEVDHYYATLWSWQLLFIHFERGMIMRSVVLKTKSSKLFIHSFIDLLIYSFLHLTIIKRLLVPTLRIQWWLGQIHSCPCGALTLLQQKDKGEVIN